MLALRRECVTKLLKAYLMVTLSNAFYKKKIFHLIKQSTYVKHRRQPRNREPPFSKDLVTLMTLLQPSRHRSHLHTASLPGCGAQPYPAGHTQCPAYHVLCHNKKLGHFSRVCCSKPVYPNHHNPLPLLFNLSSHTPPLLNMLVYLTSIMLHLLTLHPS